MAGNTGKMTAGAIAARGPRMEVARVAHGRGVAQHEPLKFVGFVIQRQDQRAIRLPGNGTYAGTFAASYSLRYLLKVAKANMRGAQ